MATSERTDGPTPNGGSYAIAYWRDDRGRPVEREQATMVEVVEYDERGNQVASTVALLGRPERPL